MMGTIPSRLRDALRPLTLICGHYGVGKTNLSCNIAFDSAGEGLDPTLVDLDIVNPYFRISEQRRSLEEAGIGLIAPVFAEAGSSLDVPSLRGAVEPALERATEQSPVIVDVGGDDAGSTALGRFATTVSSKDYGMIGVLNAYRNLVADPTEAVTNLREIERTCGLRITALVDNSHLQDETDEDILAAGYAYAEEVASRMDLPLVAVTYPSDLPRPAVVPGALAYGIKRLIVPPWH